MTAHSLRMILTLALFLVLTMRSSTTIANDTPQGKGPPPETKADQAVFHFLLENHKEIRRSVKRIENGVETLTESDNPEVAVKIQEHVAAMQTRVKEGRGLRFWDDLFVAIFKNHSKITMVVENTKKGVLVKETSTDPVTIKLIQAHAEVVSKFAKFGFDEAHKNHPVSGSDSDKRKLEFPIISNAGGIVPLPKAAEQPRQGAKIIFDITADAKPAEINKGLERTARLLNLYGAAGLKASDVKVTIVFHGDATKSILTDVAYKTKFGVDKNPNLPMIRDLRKAGVQVFVCGQALNYKEIQEVEVEKDVTIALAALTVVLNRQTEGYSYVPIP